MKVFCIKVLPPMMNLEEQVWVGADSLKIFGGSALKAESAKCAVPNGHTCSSGCIAFRYMYTYIHGDMIFLRADQEPAYFVYDKLDL